MSGLTGLLVTLRELYANGGASLATFRVPADPALHWYASRNRFDECGFIERLVSSRAMREQLPELWVEALPPDAEFEWSSENSFALDGQLAACLVSGGAYKRFEGSDGAAKALGNDFCEAVFGRRYSEVIVYRSCRPWSEWFRNIAWDSTWLLINKRARLTSLLVVTDED